MRCERLLAVHVNFQKTLVLISLLFILFQIYILQVSKEGDTYSVPADVANMSELVKAMMEGKY